MRKWQKILVYRHSQLSQSDVTVQWFIHMQNSQVHPVLVVSGRRREFLSIHSLELPSQLYLLVK